MDLTGVLSSSGPEGVFLRFLRSLTGRDELFAQRGGAVMSGGMPARVYVVSQHWVLGEGGEDARSLLGEAMQEERLHAVYFAAPGEPGPLLPGWSAGKDLLFVGPEPGETPASDEAVVSGADFWAALPRLHPALLPQIAPPPLRAHVPFFFYGLLHEGQLVSICDTTVDDGHWAVIQQVHTAPELRGKGNASRLVREVLADLARRGRRAVWVCDERNLASVAVARRAGLALHRELTLITRD